MRRFNLHLIILSLLGTMLLTSCEQPENQIIGLWEVSSLQRTAYEDGQLSATATEYFLSDEVIYWEFQDLDLLFYEGREMELEQTYSYVIEDGEMLVIYREDRDDLDFEIINLNRKELALKEEQYDTDGNILYVVETVYSFERVEE